MFDKLVRTAAIAMVLGVGLASPSQALLICTKVDSEGQIRDGTQLRLRTECKRKKDGTPKEVKIGTHEEIQTLAQHRELAKRERQKNAVRAKFDASRAKLAARLSEVHAAATADNVVLDPYVALATLDAMRAELLARRLNLSEFDIGTLKTQLLKSTATITAQALNAWIANTDGFFDRTLVRIDTARGIAMNAINLGVMLPTNLLVEFAVVESILDADTVLDCETDPASGCATTNDELDEFIKELENNLNNVGDDAELANTDLQAMLQQQQQTLDLLSNVAGMLHDTAMSIIRNIK